MVTINNSINNTVGASNSGVTNTFTVTNSSNTASSQANEIITVGGGTAGDVWTQYSIGSTTSYAAGVDNSDNDNYKLRIAASGSIDPSSGTEIFRYDNSTSPASFVFAGGTPLNAGQTVAIVKSSVGATTSLNVENTDSTNTGSNAAVTIRTNAGGAGDPVITWDVNGVSGSNYSCGIDNSDSDRWKLVQGTADLSSASIVPISIALTGEVNFPSTTAFLATATGTQDNVTGDGTVYTILYATEIFDQNNDFASSTLTAPVTGRYFLATGVGFSGIGAGNTSGYLQIVTSNRTYVVGSSNPFVTARSDGFMVYNGSVLGDMDAADTAIVQLQVGPTGKTVDIFVSAPVYTYFSGNLEC